MSKSVFTSAAGLAAAIDSYFKYIEGEYHLAPGPGKDAGSEEQKIWNRAAEPPTFTGFMYHLGFKSRQAFENYELKGKFAHVLKRGRLRIEAAYEKKLHQQSATGAIFALKNMGWNEKAEIIPVNDPSVKNMVIEIFETGPEPAERESDVVI